jgi:DNA-binding transcriptional LysR family regulator
MDASMIAWDDARFLLAIHRAGSLSEAGRKLRVNQSTASRRLTALEESLGTRVFVRTRDGYVLTPAGERILPHAERMEEEADSIGRVIRGQEARLTGTVRITGPDALTAVILVPLVAEMHARYPDIQFELVADNRNLSLTKREADLAVRVGRPVESQLLGRRLTDFANAPYASQEYIAARGKPRAPDFAGHDFIGYDESLGGAPEGLWLAARARTGRTLLRSPSTPVQHAAVLAGMGVGLLPCYLADGQPTLVRLGSDSDKVMRSVWLIVHRDLQRAAHIRACSELLAQGLVARADQLVGKTKRSRK